MNKEIALLIFFLVMVGQIMFETGRIMQGIDYGGLIWYDVM